MISMYSINFPALASLLLILSVFVYHLLFSRKHEFETVVLPSSLRIEATESGVLVSHAGSMSINSPLYFHNLVVDELYVGPKAILSGHAIKARKVVVDGEIRGVDLIWAETELTNRGQIEATQIKTPKLLLEKKSISTIQVVPKETEVVRKKNAQTRGFFSSIEEVQKATLSSQRRTPQPQIRLIRKKAL